MKKSNSSNMHRSFSFLVLLLVSQTSCQELVQGVMSGGNSADSAFQNVVGDAGENDGDSVDGTGIPGASDDLDAIEIDSSFVPEDASKNGLAPGGNSATADSEAERNQLDFDGPMDLPVTIAKGDDDACDPSAGDDIQFITMEHDPLDDGFELTREGSRDADDEGGPERLGYSLKNPHLTFRMFESMITDDGYVETEDGALYEVEKCEYSPERGGYFWKSVAAQVYFDHLVSGVLRGKLTPDEGAAEEEAKAEVVVEDLRSKDWADALDEESSPLPVAEVLSDKTAEALGGETMTPGMVEGKGVTDVDVDEAVKPSAIEDMASKPVMKPSTVLPVKPDLTGPLPGKGPATTWPKKK